jgi:hypothetical protein
MVAFCDDDIQLKEVGQLSRLKGDLTVDVDFKERHLLSRSVFSFWACDPT